MKQRIQTAIVALLVFVPFVVYGEWPFALFVYVLATIGLIELLNMQKKSKSLIASFLAIVFLWIILLPQSAFIHFSGHITNEFLIIFIMLLLTYTVFSKNKFTFTNAGFILISTLYVGIGFHFLILTRTAGLTYVLFALFVIWATDTGAYFFGRAFGKRKLWPEISPNKTIAGALGGVLSACLVGLSFQLFYPFEYSLVMILIITICVSIVGQIGDLIASAYKRHYDVKDSGKLLPGHGGILDRMDSLLFVLPFLYVINFI